MYGKIIGLGACVAIGVLFAGVATFKLSVRRHNQEKLTQLGKNQATFETFIKRVHKETPYTVYITSGHRNTEHQRRLYKQNKKNAKPGTSPHEFKRAIDINLLSYKGHVRKRDSKEAWMKTGVPQIAADMGLRWGGDFKYYHDPVHFEVRKRK